MQLRRPPRRTLALVVGLVLLGGPALTACASGYPTDQVYRPGVGTNDRDASVDVLGAVVVAAQDGSGTFVASFVNNDQANATRLDSFEGGDGSSLSATGFTPVKVAAGGLTVLAQQGGIAVTGDFKPGDFVTVDLGFSTGESVSIDVPVVTACGEYAGLDSSGASASASSSSGSTSPSDFASASESSSTSTDSSASPSASPSAS